MMYTNPNDAERSEGLRPSLWVGGVALLMLAGLAAVTAAQAEPQGLEPDRVDDQVTPEDHVQVEKQVRALFRLKLRETLTPDGLGTLLGKPALDAKRADSLMVQVAQRAAGLPDPGPRLARDQASSTIQAALNAATPQPKLDALTRLAQAPMAEILEVPTTEAPTPTSEDPKAAETPTASTPEASPPTASATVATATAATPTPETPSAT
ncbi:MAG: hypothetical protein AAFX99_23415, partial [Myxococcota bacterium]